MKINHLLFLLLNTAIFIISCGKNVDTTIPKPTTSNPNKGTPVETENANTNYPSAFEGQTRIGSVVTKTPYAWTELTSELDAPWGITNLPDGRLLITEKGGHMRIATTTGTLSNPIGGIPKVNDSGQGGLLGLTVDPNFSTSRMVYWAFSENVNGGTVTAVAKGKLSSDEKNMEAVKIIYRAFPAANSNLHYGGRVIFDASGHLLVSTGERSSMSTRPLAQSVNGALGKIVRITTDGAPAPGNPNLNMTDAAPEIYSIGHRNPQGIALHPVTGDLWESEFGPRGGDEINRVQAGKNYGWPTITYGIEYGGSSIGQTIQQKEGMEQPVYYWDPVISPSGIIFYKGNKIPEWQNNLFVSSLSARHIDRLVIENDKVVGEERLLTQVKERFRDITQGKDEALYAITDSGKLFKIDKK